jgi:citrate synthase
MSSDSHKTLKLEEVISENHNVMAEEKPVINVGLQGIYIDESSICKVDGVLGKLYYRGYSIEELANNSSYEEVAYLLLYGSLPKKEELENFESQLKANRTLSESTIGIIKSMSKKAHPTDVLRTAVSSLAAEDLEMSDNSEDANFRKAVRLIAKMPTILAVIDRTRNDLEIVPPDASLGHTDNFMYMLTGNKPNELQSKLINLMFILHAEHSSNASTFSALVTGSTLADLYAAVTSGVATLKGPLHGGADEAALKMLKAIGSPANTETYINDALAGKQRIMGFGHRVYKTYDPRAKLLRGYLEESVNSAPPDVKNLTQIALAAEEIMIDRLGQSHGIWPNIDFFAGPLYVWAGVSADLFTPIFAASRVVGWCAHMIDYWRDNKLFRPLEYYTGQLDLKYVPIEKR